LVLQKLHHLSDATDSAPQSAADPMSGQRRLMRAEPAT
jgi:hypothetical protein